jgi:tRNA threonylcarbamoyladenosine biosynthesis protein TsaB
MSAAAAVSLLAFDTSTEVLAVAVAGPKGEVALNLPGGAAASSTLLPQIEAALDAAGVRRPELAAIAFGRGPGAFTGLRTSCAVAQGLGLGWAKPLVPICSLMIVAEDAWAQHPPDRAEGTTVAVAMDARMDEIYGAVFERAASAGSAAGERGPGREAGEGGGPWRTVLEPALYPLASWNARLRAWPPQGGAALTMTAGSALAAFGERLDLPTGARAVSTEHNRAAALLRLAQQAWHAGRGVDAADALPLYLRDKVALTTVERESAKAAAGTDAASTTAAASPASQRSAR